MGGDLTHRVQHGSQRVGMGEADGQVIELAVLARPPLLLGRDLQKQRLRRHLHGRHGDAVLVGEVADRFDVGVAGVEVDVGVRDGRDGLDADAALGAVPHQRERGHALRREVQVARDDGVHHHRRPRHLRPVDLEIADALGRRLLLDQLQVLHRHQRDEDGAELLGERDLLDLLGAGLRRHCAGDRRHDQRQAQQDASHIFKPFSN